MRKCWIRKDSRISLLQKLYAIRWIVARDYFYSSLVVRRLRGRSELLSLSSLISKYMDDPELFLTHSCIPRWFQRINSFMIFVILIALTYETEFWHMKMNNFLNISWNEENISIRRRKYCLIYRRLMHPLNNDMFSICSTFARSYNFYTIFRRFYISGHKKSYVAFVYSVIMMLYTIHYQLIEWYRQ